jgi:hypothetical protein
VLSMEFIAEIRRRHFVSGESISSIARSLKLSRPTVRKALKAEAEPNYQRQHQPTPKLGEFQAQLIDWLERDAKLSINIQLLSGSTLKISQFYRLPIKKSIVSEYGAGKASVDSWKALGVD